MEDYKKAHARKISIIEGAFATIWGQFTGGLGGNSYLTGFFLWLGASPFMMSVYGSVFALASMFQPFSLALVRGFTSKKRLIQVLVWASRPVFFVLVFTAFIRSDLRVWLAILILFVFSLMTSTAGPPWQSWMSEIIDMRSRGRYFGIRNLITSAVAVPSTLIAGYLLDKMGRGFLAFTVVFVIGSIAGAFDAYMFGLQDEDVSQQRRSIFNLSLVLEALKMPGDYRKFLTAYTFWSFSIALIGPYTVVMLIKDFKYDYATLGFLLVVLTIFSAIFQPIWGKLGDKYGYFKMLKIALFFQTILALIWFMALPSIYYIVWPYIIVGVVVLAGTLPMAFNTLIGIVPDFGKTEAFSAFTSITSAATFVGNICSGVLVTFFANVHFTWGFLDVNAYRMVFLVTFIVRIFAFLNLNRLKMNP